MKLTTLLLFLPCFMIATAIIAKYYPRLKFLYTLAPVLSLVTALTCMEMYANYTGIFYTDLKTPIQIDQSVTQTFQRNMIPMPTLKVSRFISDSVSVHKNMIILPINYVSFNKAKMNYAFLLYIEANSMSKEDNAEIEKIKALAAKENKKYLLPLQKEYVIARKRNVEEINKIMRDGGETTCSFELSDLRKSCKFVSIDLLNLDRSKFVSSESYAKNLDSNFSLMVDHVLETKVFSQYANSSKTYDIEFDTDSKSVNWL